MERLDVVILGGSGFTGKYVVRELLKFWDKGPGSKRRIGLAGRSKKKLTAALIWAAGARSDLDTLLSQIQIIETDVGWPASLASLCSQTKLLISCVGPYSKHGEPVVAACVESGIDYLDISGEPHFMETMEIKYHQMAVQTGSLVISACGYDSIPAEMGVLFTTEQFVRRGWTPNSVDSYLLGSFKGGHGSAFVNFGTYESALLSLSNPESVAALRRSVPRRVRPKVPGVPARKRSLLHWEENSRTWAMKFPNADPIVVRRTQSTVAANPDGLPTPADDQGLPEVAKSRKEIWTSLKPAHYGCYLSSKSMLNIVLLLLMLLVWSFLVKFSWGRQWLLEYPRLFSFGIISKEGPSEEVVRNTTFNMWFVGRGYSNPPKSTSAAEPDHQEPDKVIVTRISGPEMGYASTPLCLIQAALIVMDSRESLPKGGVLTPGAAFATTDLRDRLHNNGLRFHTKINC